MSSEITWIDSYLDQAKAGTLDSPPSAWWLITRACNLKCYYCFANAAKKDPDELNTEEAKRILVDLAANGVGFVTFLGGEPLARKDIYDLVNYANDLGIYTALLTNGLMVTEKIVHRLKDVGCEMLGVSIDSHDPAIHDAVRGVKGSLAGAKGTIRTAIKLGMRSSVRIVVTEQSYPALPSLFQWAIDEGVEELILLPVFMVGRAAGSENDRRADLAGKELFLRALDDLREIGAPLGISVPHQIVACPQGIELNSPTAKYYHSGHAKGFEKCNDCKVGKFMVSVQPNGDVFPCPFVHHKIGSLRHQSIREIWQAPLLQKARRQDLGCIARSMIHVGRADIADPTYIPLTHA